MEIKFPNNDSNKSAPSADLWAQIKGQEEAVNYLRQALKKGALVHAYLFQGPEGVGKSLTARVLAQSLNCREGGAGPCGRCPSCLQIGQAIHPDVITVVPEGKSRVFTIEQIRNLEKLAHFNARLGGWKVFIIEDAELMNEAAGNSLLKTLEEPPPETMIVLVSARPEKLLPTVRSRAQAIRFKVWPPDLTVSLLTERAGLGEEEALVLHHVAGGRPGRSLKMAEAGFFNTRRRILATLQKGKFSSGGELVKEAGHWIELIEEKTRALESKLEEKRSEWKKNFNAAEVKAWEKMDEAVLATETRAEQELFFELIFSWFRDLNIFLRTGCEKHIINRDFQEIVKRQAEMWDARRLLRVMDLVEWSREAVREKSAPLKLVFEHLFLGIGFWEAG